MEVLIQMAMEKYFETEVEPSIGHAVRRFLDFEMLPHVKVESREKLRNRYFYTKDVDLLYRANEQ